MAGTSSGIFAAPSATGTGGWEPSVLYLLILIVAEMFVFGFIARTLR
jgi:amino acid permease